MGSLRMNEVHRTALHKFIPRKMIVAIQVKLKQHEYVSQPSRNDEI
jgi:hypothetical protein